MNPIFIGFYPDTDEEVCEEGEYIETHKERRQMFPDDVEIVSISKMINLFSVPTAFYVTFMEGNIQLCEHELLLNRFIRLKLSGKSIFRRD